MTSAPEPSTAGLTPAVRRSYALGSVATGTFGTVPGLLLLPYLTDTIGIAAALAGVIVFLPKAWDFVLNPIAGRVSDRSTHPSGRRRPFLIRYGLLLAVAFAALFAGPITPTGLATAWVLIAFLAGATAYAFFQVPFLAMAAEITSTYSERTSLMTWRIIAITVTILLTGGLSPMLVKMGGGGAPGHRLMGIVMALVIAVGALGLWWGTRNAPVTRTEEAGGRLAEQLRVVIGNPHARVLVSTFVLQAVATSMLLAGVAYAATHLTRGPADATWVFLACVGPAILVAPLWEKFGLKRGKKAGYLVASVLMLVGLVGMLSARTGSLALTLMTGAVVGIGYAGCQFFPLSMLPDVAAADAAESGVNRIGVYNGVWAGSELMGFALGPGILGLVLSLGGYVSTTTGHAEQPSSALWAIAAAFSIIPAALVGVSLLVLRRYRLDDLLRAAEG